MSVTLVSRGVSSGLRRSKNRLSSVGWNFDKLLGSLIASFRATRQDTTDCLDTLYKCVPGKYGLVAENFTEYQKKRRNSATFRSLSDPFNIRRFNFLKISHSDILMRLTNESSESDSVSRSLIIKSGNTKRLQAVLVPHVDKCWPQALNEKALNLAVETLLLSSSRQFFVTFNSPLAYCSVNHLHFGLCYIPYVSKLISSPLRHAFADVFVLENWILPGFVVQLRNRDLTSLVKNLLKITRYLTTSETPHNLVLCRAPPLPDHTGGDNTPSATGVLSVTAYVFPRNPVSPRSPLTKIRTAAMDICGLIAVYSSPLFQDLSEAKLIRCFIDLAYLPDGVFDKILKGLKSEFETDK
ncbi:unnamed protein product [Soboliphyme baturini]|uniref:GDP-D-glucose phosphorylase 1 n=1 Tax=Soboliphyme baturini TaxID=241478 RepID=A0A183IXT9_9BILA|nr:unnamed protein product [Soboliphyme baturini]